MSTGWPFERLARQGPEELIVEELVVGQRVEHATDAQDEAWNRNKES